MSEIMRNGMRPIHPGEILADELAERRLSANKFAHCINVPTNRITDILRGRRGITADTACRMAKFFGTTPRFWINLQVTYDLRTTIIAHGDEIEKIAHCA